MSVLIALVDGADTVIACDGRVTGRDGRIFSESAMKWNKGNRIAIGLAGSARLLDLMRESPSICDDLADKSDAEIADAIRNLAINDGWKDDAEDGKPRWYSLEMLIARPGRIVSYDGTMCSTVDFDYAAIGSGCDFSIGALDALAGVDIRAEEKVRVALASACRRMNTCGGAVYVDRIALPIRGAA